MTWNDLNLGQISIARYGFYKLYDVNWYTYHFLEPAQEPAMPNLSFGNLVVQPFLYRNTALQEDGLFKARIIRYNFPSTPVLEDKITGILQAQDLPRQLGACGKIMSAKLGNINLTSVHYDTTQNVELHGLSDSAYDSNGYLPVNWNDKKGVRSFVFNVSSGDTINYQRNFRVGAYEAGDTAIVADSLKGLGDYLRARIYLRRAINDSVISYLDTAMLCTTGFVQSSTLLDSGKRSFPVTFSDSVYMTMEFSRGDTTNSYILTRVEVHGDVQYESFAAPDTSYKKASPTPTSTDGMHRTSNFQ